MRIRNFDEMMVGVRAAASGVHRLRGLVQTLNDRVAFSARVTLQRREKGLELVSPDVDADGILVYCLLESDPLAAHEDDPLATLIRIGPADAKITAIGLLPHAADPFWHGLRILLLAQELLSERRLDNLPVPALIRRTKGRALLEYEMTMARQSRHNVGAHLDVANYQMSRTALDVLDTFFGGRIRLKANELKVELTGPALSAKMRTFIGDAVDAEFYRSASDEEAHARALAIGLCLPALLEPQPPDPYN